MTWAKVKSLNYLLFWNGIDNLVTSAIVEFGVTLDGVDQPSYAQEIDLLVNASFEGSFIPLGEMEQDQAMAIVINAIGTEALDLLKLKAELAFLPTETKFLSF